MHILNTGKETYIRLFPSKLGRCTLLEVPVDRVYLEHTTRRVPSETTTSTKPETNLYRLLSGIKYVHVSFSVSLWSFSVSFQSFLVSFRSFSVSFRYFTVFFQSFSVGVFSFFSVLFSVYSYPSIMSMMIFPYQ